MQFVNKVPHVLEALFLLCDAPDSESPIAAQDIFYRATY